MFRLIRLPRSLDKFCRPLQRHFRWDHFEYFRLLVVVMAFAWGRPHVAKLYRDLEARHHRTRFNNCFLVQRWDPEAALQQKAQELLRALAPQPGDTVSLILDDSKHAKRGTPMDAIATLKDPTTEAYRWGHQYVCSTLRFRPQVIPWGIRRYVNKEACAAVGVPFRQTTALAAQRMREFTVPAGVKVTVRFDAYYLCATVLKACREKRFRLASTLKRNRRLCKPGWQLKAGR